jgi:hypothetical protein
LWEVICASRKFSGMESRSYAFPSSNSTGDNNS